MKLKKQVNGEQGFSLIETAIALVTLSICLAYAMPLFLYAKINNSKSEIRTGALIVAQRTFDRVRARSIESLPDNDGKNSPSANNPESIPANINSVSAPEKLVTFAMGRQYQTTVTYCEDKTTIPAICSRKYRGFKIEVNYNGQQVYNLNGTFTDFE
jgi:type II secretory pathway pseudopilin PulG